MGGTAMRLRKVTSLSVKGVKRADMEVSLVSEERDQSVTTGLPLKSRWRRLNRTGIAGGQFS
jgi:hypothetical protein